MTQAEAQEIKRTLNQRHVVKYRGMRFLVVNVSTVLAVGLPVGSLDLHPKMDAPLYRSEGTLSVSYRKVSKARMNRATVMRLAKAKWGKDACVQENKYAPDPETREIVRREYQKHLERKPEPPAPTPEQLKYEADLKRWKEEASNLRGKFMGLKRYKVGRIPGDSGIGPYFAVEGDGDTWERGSTTSEAPIMNAVKEAKLFALLERQTKALEEIAFILRHTKVLEGHEYNTNDPQYSLRVDTGKTELLTSSTESVS